MPRPRKVPTAPAPNSMVASAARLTARRQDRPLGTGPEDWQIEAWHHFDVCAELSAATTWTANAMSQVKLRLMVEGPDGKKVPVTDDTTDPLGRAALDAMAALFDGDAGQGQMMASLGTHLSIPGEAYLLGRAPSESDGEDGRDQWSVVSNDELKETAPGSGRWQLDRGDGKIETFNVATRDAPVDNEALIIRVWRAHPRKHVLATSPVRAALPVLRQIEGLAKHDASGIDSRLAGAGILLVPSEMTFQTPMTDGQPPTDAEADEFLTALAEAMEAALRDQGSAAARVPIVVKAPGAFLSGVQHITFENRLDAAAGEKLEANVRRLAIGLDMPPEELLGKGDVNHWTGWLVSEDGIKVHIEPLADLVAEAIQTRYLWYAMQGTSMVFDPAIKQYTLEPDTSALRQRALDLGQAMAMHAAFLISDDALLRETRFNPGDKPDDEERKRRFLELVAQGTPSADLVAGALDIITNGALEPAPSAVPAEQRGNISPAEELPAPGDVPVPLPGPDVPPQEAPQGPPPAGPPAAALVAAAGDLHTTALRLATEQVVFRAVEKAWNRAGKRGNIRRPVEASKLDACLTGAWEHVPSIAAALGVDQARLEAALDRYARGLLTTGTAHDQRIFTRLLTEQVLAVPGELGAA